MPAMPRWALIALLHSPITGTPPCRASASVTIPAGLVKFTSVACGASSRISRAISSTTGTVRSALAKPPTPVVSWPIRWLRRPNTSSPWRAACPQLRDHKIGPRNRTAAVAGQLDFEGRVGECSHALRERADHRQPLLVRVDQPDLFHA